MPTRGSPRSARRSDPPNTPSRCRTPTRAAPSRRAERPRPHGATTSSLGVDVLGRRDLEIRLNDLRCDARRACAVPAEFDENGHYDLRVIRRRETHEPRMVVRTVLRVLRAARFPGEDGAADLC